MKNSFYFLLYLGLNLILLNIVAPKTDKYQSRYPSAIINESVSSCIKSIKSFFKKPVIDENLYLEYLKKYQSSNVTDKKTFDSIEDYAAWLDWRVSKEEFSVAKYYLAPGILSNYKKAKLSLSRPDKIVSFFFSNVLDSIIKDSVKIEGLDNYRYIFLKSFLTKKLTNEALLEFNKVGSKKSFWAKMSHSRFSKIISNLISYAPIAFGHPPLKIPGFLLKSEKNLLGAKNTDEAIEMYMKFTKFEKGSLSFKVSYDHFKKYYFVGVAGYYYYFTYLDFELVNNQEDMLDEVSAQLDQSTRELVELASPSCQSVLDCLEEYRQEWDNEGNNLYYEYKNTCKEVYNIQEDC